jgi:hypothetical protein
MGCHRGPMVYLVASGMLFIAGVIVALRHP